MESAEFDQFADEYHSLHANNIRASGEAPEFFAEYKIVDAARVALIESAPARAILDFGSGIGNSVPWFRKYFPDGALTCCDPSERSLQLSQRRFPGPESYVNATGDLLPLEPEKYDLCFSACVFHHIPHQEHAHWLAELSRVTRPNGLLIIFEHNPLNPLTRAAVDACPFDKNACLISAGKLAREASAAGWRVTRTWYRIFFPRFLQALRPLETHLRRVPFGAQYCLVARKA